MQSLIVPMPGRSDSLIPFKNDEVQAGPSKTRTDRESCGTSANDGNVRMFCHSLLCLLEVAQVRRGLVPSGRHQQPIRAEEIVFLAEDDLVVAFGAIILAPAWMRTRIASIGLVDRPRLRQGMVDHRDLVMENARIVLVEIEALLEYRLIVEMQRQARSVIGTGTFEAARFDFKHVIAAITVLIDPL